jgi:hypothetical protein
MKKMTGAQIVVESLLAEGRHLSLGIREEQSFQPTTR